MVLLNEFFKPYNLFSGIIWAILSPIILFLIFNFVPGISRIFKVTRRLLQNNRPGRRGIKSSCLPSYAADRFIHVWYSRKKPLRFAEGFDLYKNIFGPNSLNSPKRIDEILEGEKLVKIDDSRNGYRIIKPIVNWRNWLIYLLCKYYLVIFTGDENAYYENLKNQAK
jgi:hypothetical protein